MSVIPILVILGALYYFTTADEKKRVLRVVLRGVGQARDVAVRLRPAPGPFDEALRGRARWVAATPALAALSVVVFFCMLVAPGALSDPETLVRWGGSFGPRTTNGEWWRLITAMFVHASFFQLLVNVAALVQMGLILERLFGRLSFASLYLAAGLTSSVVSLSMHPIGVATGASGSVWGVLGLYVTWLIAGTIRRSPLTVPLTTILMTCPAVGLFVIYSMAAGFNGRAEMAGLVVGVVYGLVLAKDAGERTPPLLRAAATMGAVVLMAVPVTVPLRGLTDVRPELERVAAIEQRTVSTYDSAVGHFTKGEIPIRDLAELIDRTILPELQAARARLKQLAGVPREHQPMVAAAAEYLTLREKSWRVRADALRRINKATLRQADQMEDAAVRVLESIAPVAQ
jgi:membrane associated rhomboid family serine protease